MPPLPLLPHKARPSPLHSALTSVGEKSNLPSLCYSWKHWVLQESDLFRAGLSMQSVWFQTLLVYYSVPLFHDSPSEAHKVSKARGIQGVIQLKCQNEISLSIKMESYTPFPALSGNLLFPRIVPYQLCLLLGYLSQVFSAVSDPELRPPLLYF